MAVGQSQYTQPKSTDPLLGAFLNRVIVLSLIASRFWPNSCTRSRAKHSLSIELRLYRTYLHLLSTAVLFHSSNSCNVWEATPGTWRHCKFNLASPRASTIDNSLVSKLWGVSQIIQLCLFANRLWAYLNSSSPLSISEKFSLSPSKFLQRLCTFPQYSPPTICLTHYFQYAPWLDICSDLPTLKHA